MKEGQEKIYYITADSYAAAKSSPHLELLRKKGIEVLLLSDRIDEWMMSYLTEFDGKAFQSVAKADESLDKLADEVDESTKEAEKALEPFVERVKNLLGDRVKEVRLTHRLTDTPAIVTTDADEMSTQMAKLFAAAAAAPEVKYIFELNPAHQLVKRAADTRGRRAVRRMGGTAAGSGAAGRARHAGRSEPVYPPYEPAAGFLTRT